MSGDAEAVERAITSRRSIRAYLPKPVPKELVEHLLDVAARAPSGTNMQPWRCHVLMGAARQRLVDALVADIAAGVPEESDYRYYPPEFFDPFLSRRRKVGWDMYALLGIQRGEGEKMKRQHVRNYEFFDAPVGMILCVEKRMGNGQWIDCGIFLDQLMLLAREKGLHTCPQAAFSRYQHVVRRELGIPEDQTVICGLALGYADPDVVPNSLITERAPIQDFTTWFSE